MLELKGPPVVVWLSPSASRDAGTGRCRLPRSLLQKLQVRPGDGLVVEVRGSCHLFLCSASLSDTDSEGRGAVFTDKGAQMAGPYNDVAQADGCIQLPLTALPDGQRARCEREGPDGESGAAEPTRPGLARGAVHVFKRNAGPASSIRLRAVGFDGVPPAAVRVGIADALNNHLVCVGAELVIPHIGTVTVDETVPGSGPVVVLTRTRVSWVSSGEARARDKEFNTPSKGAAKETPAAGTDGGGGAGSAAANEPSPLWPSPSPERSAPPSTQKPPSALSTPTPAWMPPTGRRKTAISFTSSPSPAPAPSPSPAPATPTTASSPSLPTHPTTPSTPAPPSPSQNPTPANSSPSPSPSPLPPSHTASSPHPSTTPPLPAHLAAQALPQHLPFSSLAAVSARSKTQLRLQQIAPKAENLLIGADGAIKTLRDVMWVMWEARDRIANVKLRPSKGVLVYGPRGTGKTTLVKAMSQEFDAVLFTVTADEVYRGGGGEGEALLRSVFRGAADEMRSVILLEDLDAMCPIRQVGRDAQARVVAQLLSLMDGAKEAAASVIIVGTTCKPNSIDMALRRPGRLDREVPLSAPTAAHRKAMLELFLRPDARHGRTMLTLADSVSLELIARETIGFVGANLRTLCARAAAACILREAARAGDAGAALRTPGAQGGQGGQVLQMDAVDFRRAFALVRHAAGGVGFEVQANLEGALDSEVGGLEEVKVVLRQAIEWQVLYAHKLKALGVRPSRGVLLYGAPGCGKTSLVRAAASVSGIGFLKANGAELFSAFLGESERILRELFARARGLQPCVLFLDEIDAIVGRRSLEGSGDGAEASGVQQRILSTMLNELDGIDSAAGVVLVGATNRLDMIDAALLRPGRFDHLVEVPLPDAAGRQDILVKSSRGMPLSPDVDFGRVAQDTEGFTGAGLARICKEAALAALREDVTAAHIHSRHFQEAIKDTALATVG